MKTLSYSLLRIIFGGLFIIVFITNCGLESQAKKLDEAADKDKKSIKLAILLDTSNSMDGLIDQAKAQLWSIVNELSKAKCDGIKPELNIALYEYGNDRLPMTEGYIRMVTPLTNDLDQISNDLFKLTTNGGQEYCGYVIGSALKELEWNQENKEYQVIFIAGNEPFDQGRVNFRESCTEANKKGVVVNTIYCGPYNEGINTHWKKGAELTGGSYFSIEQDRKTVYIPSPYDNRIIELNNQLNDTYIFYGSSGRAKKEMQSTQDKYAATYGQANEVNRVVSKTTHNYKNKSWDLIDASEEHDFNINEMKEESLPQEMQGLDEAGKMKYIAKKKEERERISNEILELNKKRTTYLAQKAEHTNKEGMLDNAIVTAVKSQAKALNYTFE